MSETPDFADLQAIIVGWLQRETGVRTSGSIPDDLTSPALVVFDLPGDDYDGLAEEQDFEVQAFAGSRDAARTLAGQARAALRRLGGRDTKDDGSHLVDWVKCRTTPSHATYENPNVVVFGALYRVAARIQ